MTPLLVELSVCAGLFVLMLGSLEAGFRAGLHAAGEGDAQASGHVGALQGALLGLLGLLLAFSFAAAGARFLERQDLIALEANAIGTAYLRADLLDEPHRSELRAALQRYTTQRLEVSAQLREGLPAAALEEVRQLQARMWRAALAGVTARPGVTLAVLPPVNEVIDLHSLRLATGVKHVPRLVMTLLILSSALAVGVIGYGAGLGRNRRAPLTAPLALLIGAALWITIDLDHPRGGLMQLSDAPLQDLRFDGP